jgi:hypothetical protein
MKHPRYNGQLLLLTGRDPAGHNLDLAVALVPVEDGEAYHWFLQNVKKGDGMAELLNSSGTVIFSDRANGLGAALSFVFPQAHNFSCFVHIMRNIEAAASKKGPGRIPKLGPYTGLCWAIARATSAQELDAKFAELEAVNPGKLLAAYHLFLSFCAFVFLFVDFT